MQGDIYNKGGSWTVEGGTDPRGSKVSRGHLALAGSLLATAIVGLVLLSTADKESSPDEVQAEALIGPNKVLLGNYPEGPRWLDLYRHYQDLFGEPLIGQHSIGQDPACLSFTYAIPCWSSYPGVKGSQWEYPLLMLGAITMPPGINREVDAPLAPAAKAFIDVELTAKGRDYLYVLGRSLSAPTCDSKSCYQWFERQCLTFPSLDSPASQVQLSPLGRFFGQ